MASTTQTKKNTRKKSTRKKNTKKVDFRDTKLFSEIVGLIFVLFGSFGFYALVAKEAGAIGNSLGSLFHFLFGKSSYLFTIFIIVLGIYFIVKGLTYWMSVVLPLALFTLNFSIAITMIDDLIIENIFSLNIFQTALHTNDGGGFIGIFFTSILVKLFSTYGTIIILLITTLIASILISRKSLYEGIVEFRENHKNRPKRKILPNLEFPIEKPALSKSKRHSILKEKPYTEPEEIVVNKDEKIKILDYADIRNKNIETNPTTNKGIKVKNQKEVEEKIIQLEDQTSNGPLIQEHIPKDYVFPSPDLLNTPIPANPNSKKEIIHNASTLEKTLRDFGINTKVVEVSMGPSVTRYELQLEPGVKVSKIVNLSNDLALSLATTSVRIEAPIPGKSAVGIEVPNKETAIVNIREVLDSTTFKNFNSKICFALGKELSGNVVVGDLAKMPHVLIAGATGSGKSVCINSIIASILYKATPEEVKLILIDPKMVELNNYNGIPHLLIPVVTEPKHAAGALNWAIKEMTERYKTFKDQGVRDINRYNQVVGEKGKKLMPRLVIIIDELADLMMVSPREVENAICRLAQLARAAGIHLVLATQRPSVDVITGLIKANVPSRISFAVSSSVDSRTILDMGGAEKLLGRGDMLYHPVGEAKPVRIQGTFISDIEVEKVVEFVKQQGDPSYSEKVIEEIKDVKVAKDHDDFEDDMLPQAIELTLESDTISTSMIQRKLRVGYARAGRIIDEMEEKGIISGPEGSKPRRVLLSKEAYYENMKSQEE